MTSYRGICIVDDAVSMSVHSLSKCLFSLSNVLFAAKRACYKVDDFHGAAGNIVEYGVSFTCHRRSE